MARIGVATVGSFFHKCESHKITYRSRKHKTKLDLVLIRKQQLWKNKSCNAIAGEHTTTQHKPVVFVVRMKRTTPNKIVGRKTIKWWKCRDGVAVEYREMVKVKYEELGEEVDEVEEEWKKYKDAFVGNAEELCGRSTGMGGKARKNQEWWTTEVASAIREKKEAWKVIENMKVNGNQPDGGMLHLYGQKKKAAKKAVDKARNEMRAEMVDVAGEIGARWTKRLLNACMRQCKVPEDWWTGLIVPIWKRKGDAQDPAKYRGITLLSHILKLPERILDKRLRERIEQELGEEQLGFRKGRGTTDGMFSLRQLVERRMERQ